MKTRTTIMLDAIGDAVEAGMPEPMPESDFEAIYVRAVDYLRAMRNTQLTTPTKGPWHVDGHNMCAVIHKSDAHDNKSGWLQICECRATDKPLAERKANTKLIAAAPDLLDALIAIVNQHDPSLGGLVLPPSDGELQMMKRAINKATDKPLPD